MIGFVEVKGLAGVSFVRADAVLVVQYVDPQRCTVVTAGGASLPCTEPAKDIMARVRAALNPTA